MSSGSTQDSIFSNSLSDGDELDEFDVEPIWSNILDSLNEAKTVEDFENVVQSIKNSLLRHMKWVSLDDIQTALLQHVMPTCVLLVSRSLEEVSKYVAHEPKSTPLVLQVLKEVLSVLNDTLIRIISWNRIEFKNILSLPSNIASILLQSFSFCKSSVNVFGASYKTHKDQIASIFTKTCELNTNLFILLNNVLIYNDESVLSLIEVIELLLNIGEIVVSLDMKTLVEHWKGVTKLIQQNLLYLNSTLKIKKPVEFLADSVLNILKTINIKELSNADKRNLKVGSLFLKLIITWSEWFISHLNDSLDSLINLTIELYEYSQPCLCKLEVPAVVIDEIDSHLTVGIEPLFHIIFKNEHFHRKNFEKFNKILLDTELKNGHLLLLILILNKIPTQAGVWYSDRSNIFDLIFRAICKSHVQLSQNIKILIPNNTGAPFLVDLYESLLLYTSSNALNLNRNQFKHLEKLMIDAILDYNYWKALFAIDLWCILGRYSPSSLNFEQLKSCTSIFKSIPEFSFQPKKIFLSFLMARLYSLLADSDKTKYTRMYPVDQNLGVWVAIGLDHIPGHLFNNVVYNEVSNNYLNQTQNFNKDNMSVHEFDQMCTLALVLHSRTNSVSTTKISNSVTELYSINPNSILQNLNSGNINTQIWFFYSLYQLTSALIPYLNHSQIQTVLTQIQNMFTSPQTKPSALIKLSVIEILKSLAHKQIEPRSIELTVNVFQYVLADQCPILKEFSLITFDYFAHNTKHDEIIVNTITKNPELQMEYYNFARKMVFDANLEEYLRLQVQNYDNIEPQPKRLRLEVKDCSEVINQLEKNVNTLLRDLSGEFYKLSVDDKKKLKAIDNNLSRLRQLFF